MIPRLWVCTSHPVLELLALPLHPMVILALILVEPAARARWGPGVARRVRRLWLVLLLVGAGTFALVALPGWVVYKLGANPNPIFMAARYIWVAAAWVAIGLALAWGARGIRAVAKLDELWTPKRFFANLGRSLAFVTFIFLGLTLFNSNSREPWSIPYEIGAFFFDAFTTDLSSDECLAFRAVDDEVSFGSWYPGVDAGLALRRHGKSGIPGIANYLSDRLSKTSGTGYPYGVSQGLLAMIAEGGDHPLLQQCEKYPEFETGKMRACIRAGRHVVWTNHRTWQCDP